MSLSVLVVTMKGVVVVNATDRLFVEVSKSMRIFEN